MKSLNYLLVLLMGVAFALISCEQEPLITPQPSSSDDPYGKSDQSVKENNGTEPFARVTTVSYLFKVGAPFFGPPFPEIVVATASNGDIIEVAGQGTLSIHPKTATGNGTFTHKDSDGTIVLGSGTWMATELLSFQEYGPSTDPANFPPNLRAGYANIKVHLTGGGAEFPGILRVYCVLPGAKVPASTPEGILLNIPGVANFNKVAGEGGFGGPTLFILQ